MSNINKMLKQAQKMQKEVENAQNQLSEMEINYSCNGVKVVAIGDFTIKSISISEELVALKDKEMLDDVILLAINGAIKEVREKTESKLSGITGGLNIPGLF